MNAPEGATRSIALALLLIVLVFLAFHLPYLPASLEDLDSINFALGMRRFDVAQHQPHPPGYPVFVAAAKLAHGLIAPEAKALALVSVAAAVLGVHAIFALYRRFDADGDGLWAVVATSIAITAPLYWFTAVRPLSDMAGLAAAVGVQVLTLAASTDRRLMVAAACAGLAIGIRSQVMWLTVPLLAYRCVQLRTFVKPAAGFVAGTLIWLVPLVGLSGGPAGYLRALSSQGTEDFTGIRMVWTMRTPRVAAEAVYNAFVAPWARWPAAAVVLTLAAIGAAALWRRRSRALGLLAVAFGPYLAFDLLFQETFTVRYALPLVIPVAFLVAAGLRAIPIHAAALVVAAALVMFDAHVGGRSVAAYSRTPPPVFQLLDDMRGTATATQVTPVLAPDRRQSLDLRRPMAWFGSAAPAFAGQLPAPPQHEWLEAVKYWNGGGRAPVWFVVDPRRAAMELIQHRDPTEYRWSLPDPVLLGGTRPNDADWYRVQRPDWYVGEGWSLTPESAGVAQSDRRGLEFGPINAWVRRDALNGGALAIGGRNFDRAGTLFVTIGDGRLWTHTIDALPGAFSTIVRLASAGNDASASEYVELTVKMLPPVRAAIEQFDASASRGVLTFGQGWHEPELNPSTGRRWRWLSDRGELHYVTGPGASILHIEGESPRTYYARGSRLVIRAGDTVLKEVTLGDDFALDVPVPSAAEPSTLIVETDQIHVPADRGWRRTADRRRLGLRIYKCELR